jgi:ribonuclease VapC
MVIDSSALIAILLDESDRPSFENAIERADVRLICAMTKLETGIVMVGRYGAAGGVRLDHLLERIRAIVIPFDEEQADIARDAFARYGKGRSRAGLNFGDCAAYALATAETEPLLCKGDDFAGTNIEIVPLT